MKLIKYITINSINHTNKNPQKSNSLDSCNSCFQLITAQWKITGG